MPYVLASGVSQKIKIKGEKGKKEKRKLEKIEGNTEKEDTVQLHFRSALGL